MSVFGLMDNVDAVRELLEQLKQAESKKQIGDIRYEIHKLVTKTSSASMLALGEEALGADELSVRRVGASIISAMIDAKVVTDGEAQLAFLLEHSGIHPDLDLDLGRAINRLGGSGVPIGRAESLIQSIRGRVEGSTLIDFDQALIRVWLQQRRWSELLELAKESWSPANMMTSPIRRAVEEGEVLEGVKPFLAALRPLVRGRIQQTTRLLLKLYLDDGELAEAVDLWKGSSSLELHFMAGDLAPSPHLEPMLAALRQSPEGAARGARALVENGVRTDSLAALLESYFPKTSGPGPEQVQAERAARTAREDGWSGSSGPGSEDRGEAAVALALMDRADAVGVTASDLLSAVRSADDQRALVGALASLHRFGRPPPEGFSEVVGECLSNPDTKVRAEAAVTLGAFPGAVRDAEVEALTALVMDADGVVSWHAGWALRRLSEDGRDIRNAEPQLEACVARAGPTVDEPTQKAAVMAAIVWGQLRQARNERSSTALRQLWFQALTDFDHVRQRARDLLLHEMSAHPDLVPEILGALEMEPDLTPELRAVVDAGRAHRA